METHAHLIQPKLESIPAQLISIRDYCAYAQKFIPHDIMSYIEGGAGDELTAKKNQTQFDRIEILPRVLKSFDQADTSVSLLGHRHRTPILLAPIAHHMLVHQDGELASLKGADVHGIAAVSATLSSTSMEAIAANADTPPWFQLYFQTDRHITLDLVRRAEAANYQALVVTVDAPISGLRHRVQRSGFTMPAGVVSANLKDYKSPLKKSLAPHQSIILNGYMADAPTWDDLVWLQKNTSLAILIKGILAPEDAIHAKKLGFQGIVVSNHGGRNLDCVPASSDCLAKIRAAVGPDYLVLFDSGIRRGSDIFKALALGADAVLVGRPYIYALSIAGALGVAHCLKILIDEFEITMALAGCPTIDDISATSLS